MESIISRCRVQAKQLVSRLVAQQTVEIMSTIDCIQTPESAGPLTAETVSELRRFADDWLRSLARQVADETRLQLISAAEELPEDSIDQLLASGQSQCCTLSETTEAQAASCDPDSDLLDAHHRNGAGRGSIARRTLTRFLKKNGFETVSSRNGHHKLVHSSGKHVAVPIVRELPIGTLRQLMNTVGEILGQKVEIDGSQIYAVNDVPEATRAAPNNPR